MSSSIKCPHCQSEISLTEALAHDAVQHQLADERAKVIQTVTAEVRGKLDQELADRNERLKAETARNKELSETERDMRAKVRLLEDKVRDADLEAARKFDEDRRRIEQEAGKRAAADFQMKVQERDHLIDGMKKTIEELNRKAEQGSQQAQGEVVELAVERTLKESFKDDEIEPVAKGRTGSDVIQTVFAKGGATAGRISWEVKRTKSWKAEWLSKAKSDCLVANADIAVIITQTLPSDVESLDLIDGVYVVSFDYWRILAVALRRGLIDLHALRASQAGFQTKATKVYAFVTGSKFSQQIDTIVRGYIALKEQLDKEKRALAKCWSERERILADAMEMTAAMHGEIQAIAGEDLAECESLGLDAFGT